MEKICYLDNAATTKCFAEIGEIFKENIENFYNASAGYGKAISVKKNLENAREKIVSLLHGSSGKLIFTSSATESNNMVFFGTHLRAGQKVLISAGEHPSVYNSSKELEKRGIAVEIIPIDSSGGVDEEEYKKLLQDENVALVSIIHTSNETGHINDIAKLCKMAKSVNKNIIFHSDGVQAFGKIKVNLNALGVDLYTISAHKVYAPRGIAGLWIKNQVVISPILFGGGQENGLRSSTENVAGALCFLYSAQKACNEIDANLEIVQKRKDELVELLEKSEIGKFLKINSQGNCSPYILSLSVLGVKGEVLMRALESENILISTGSACSAKYAGNRVLSCMGLSQEEIVGSVRISFSPYEDFDAKFIAEKFEKTALKFLGAK